MRTIDFNGKEVVVYDSIEQLPMKRFHKYNKLLLIDAGFGSDLQAIDRRLQRVGAYLEKNDLAKAYNEMTALRQAVWFIQENMSPKFSAFACLVARINGEARNDISEEGLAETIKMLDDCTIEEITGALDEAKKKIDSELTDYFPNIFRNRENERFYELLRKRSMAVLDGVGTDDGNASAIEKIEGEMAILTDPPEKDFEIKYDREFEDMNLVISREYNIKPKELTVLEYYNTIEHITKENKQKLKAISKNGRR